MKTVEELKQEQYDLKAKLHEVIELTNSKEYFELSPREKGLIGKCLALLALTFRRETISVHSLFFFLFLMVLMVLRHEVI